MTEQSHTEDNVRIRVFDADEVQTPSDAVNADPKRDFSTHNTTRPSYHEAVVSELNGINTDIEVDAFALGDSTADTIQKGDILENELFRTSTVDTSVRGQTFRCSVFIDSTEAIGSFSEAALVAERVKGDIGINRFLIGSPGGLLSPKSAGETVTVDIEILQSDA